jgi:hypothetical protein
MSKATTTKTKKGNAAKQPSRKRKQTVPELPEKTKKLILKAFQKTYEAHHGKNS